MNDDMEKRMKLILDTARQLSEDQADLAEVYLMSHPEKYPSFSSVRNEMDSLQRALKSIISNHRLIDDYHTIHLVYSSLLASESYLRGAKDALRLFHACITSET